MSKYVKKRQPFPKTTAEIAAPAPEPVQLAQQALPPIQAKPVARPYIAEPLVKALKELDDLPVAQLRPMRIQDENGDWYDTRQRFGLTIGNRLITTVSNHYRLVQHKEAFEPILRQLMAMDEKDKLKIRLSSSGSEAKMDAILEADVLDTVRLGFRVKSMIDGRHSIQYSFAAERVSYYIERVAKKEEVASAPGKLKGKNRAKLLMATPVQPKKPDEPAKFGAYRYIEVVGYRKTCSNGMRIRIPVAEAEKGIKAGRKDIYDVKTVVTEVWEQDEKRERVQELLKKFSYVPHIGRARNVVEEQGIAVKLMMDLRNPVKRLIERAEKAVYATPEEAMEALVKVVGTHKAKQIEFANIQAGQKRPKTAWDLYNWMTWFSSHMMADSAAKDSLEARSADYLVMLTGAKQ